MTRSARVSSLPVRANSPFACAVLMLSVVVGVLFHPLLWGNTFNDIASRQNEVYPWAATPLPFPPTLHYDQPDQFYPYQAFVNRVLREGELPLWNPHSFGGQPFFASGAYPLLYLPRTLLALVVSPAHVQDSLVVGHMLLGGVGMYLLLTQAALGFPAALFGALAWMLNSFMLSWSAFGAPTILWPGLPLSLLLLRKVLRDGSWSASLGFGGALLLLLFGGSFVYLVLLFPVLGSYAAATLVARWWPRLRGLAFGEVVRSVAPDLTRLALPAVLVAGLAPIQLLPTIELVRSVNRAALPYDEYRALSVPVEHLVYFFVPPVIRPPDPRSPDDGPHDVLFGDVARDALRLPALNDPYHSMLFSGTPTAVLALVGLFARGSLATFARWLSVVVVLIVLGTPATWLAYYALPGASTFKPLGRFLFLFNFAAAILAAYGLNLWLRWAARRSADRATTALLPPRRYGVALVLVLGTVAQMVHFAPQVLRQQPSDPAYLLPETPLIRALGTYEGARILPVALSEDIAQSPYGRTLYGATPLLFGLDSATGYEILLPERIANLWRVAGEGETPEHAVATKLYWSYAPAFGASSLRYDLLARLAVTHLVTRPDIERDPAWTPDLIRRAGLESTYDGPDGRIYRIANPLPRAYLASSCERVDSPRAALERFADPTFDPSRAVVVEAAFAASPSDCAPSPGGMPPDGAPGSAEIVARRLNELSIRVEAEREAWLVVSESWDPGWRATIDGEAAHVVPGQYAFRALRVAAGVHTVELRYRPTSILIGAAITAATLAILAGVFAVRGLAARRAGGAAIDPRAPGPSGWPASRGRGRKPGARPPSRTGRRTPTGS